MKKIFFSFIMTLAIADLTCNGVIAGDSIYRITHNDQNVLALGKVTEITDEYVDMEVTNTIVSEQWLNEYDKKIQLKPDTAKIILDGYKIDSNIEVGDFVVASLNKSLLDYKIEWIFKEITTDEIGKIKFAEEGIKSNAVSIKLEYFLNNNGKVLDTNEQLDEYANGSIKEESENVNDENLDLDKVVFDSKDKKAEDEKNAYIAVISVIAIFVGIMIGKTFMYRNKK